MDFFINVLEASLEYFPLILGAYMTILIMRFPDLTIEATWSISAIVTGLCSGFIFPTIAPLVGIFVGALCGLMTGLFFKYSGGTKLLSSLISYSILWALGFHLLPGGQSSIDVPLDKVMFGFYGSEYANVWVIIIYSLVAIVIFFFIWWLQKTDFGIKCRLVGEKPNSANYLNISINKHYIGTLIISNMIIGLGGGMFAINNGFADNFVGIQLILVVFIALLLGDEIYKLLGFKRSEPIVAVIGVVIYYSIVNIAESLGISLQNVFDESFFKASDKHIIIGLFFLLILWVRRSGKEKNKVSQW